MNEGGKHVMDTFADYVLEEEDLASKMEIVYYLSKKGDNTSFFCLKNFRVYSTNNIVFT